MEARREIVPRRRTLIQQGEPRMDRQQPEEGAPFVNIIGELVALGPLRRDLPYQRWYSDFSTTRTTGKTGV